MIGMTKTTVLGEPIPQWSTRDSSWYGTFWVVAACLAVLATLFLSGCTGSSGAHVVDETRAREALKTALDQWKAGGTVKSLESSATPMTIQDFDWMAGTKLIDYQIVDDGKAYDANLRIRVKLSLNHSSARAAGRPTEKTVWYVVSTSPAVTVFRDALRR